MDLTIAARILSLIEVLLKVTARYLVYPAFIDHNDLAVTVAKNFTFVAELQLGVILIAFGLTVFAIANRIINE